MKLIAALTVSVFVLAAQTERPAPHSVTAVRHWSLTGVTRVVVEVSGEFNFVTERLHNPERVYFDIPNSRPHIESRRVYSEQVDDKLLKRIRVAETAPRRDARGARPRRRGGCHYVAAHQSESPGGGVASCAGPEPAMPADLAAACPPLPAAALMPPLGVKPELAQTAQAAVCPTRLLSRTFKRRSRPSQSPPSRVGAARQAIRQAAVKADAVSPTP